MACAHVGSNGYDTNNWAQGSAVRERRWPSTRLGPIPRNYFSIHHESLAAQVIGSSHQGQEWLQDARYSVSITDEIQAGMPN